MEPSGSHDRPDEISKLESKVVLALSRLQKSRYPTRQGKSGGVASKQIANYLANHYCYLDGDIESQVITALLSCVRNGLICALNNGKFRLLNPSSKNMATFCVARTSHGPECTCLNVINAQGKNPQKTCCSYKGDGFRIKIKVGKSSDRERHKPRKAEAKKSPYRAKTKVTRQAARRSQRVAVTCVQKEEKALGERKKTLQANVVPPTGVNGKFKKCKYCLEKHPQPDSSGKKLCPKCHPPGTRYGVPFDKFSPRDELTSN